MIKPLKIWILMLFLGTIMMACSYAIEINITNLNTGVPTFSLDEKSYRLIGCRPKVREIAVYPKKEGQSNHQDPMWLIESDGKLCTQEISYGKVPKGFNPAIPAKPLRRGETYEFVVRAWGSSGWKDFSIP